MLDKQIAAGVSKAVRNADLNGLPAGLVAEYYAEAKRIVAKGGKVDASPATPEDIAEVRERIFKTFETQQISRDEIVAYISRHPELETEEAVVAHLQGALNAIADNAMTVEEMFATGQEAPIAQPSATTKPAGAGKAAQEAAKTQKPPVPAGTREMVSKRESKCDVCKKDVLISQKIVYDPNKGRATHREHYA